MAAAAPSTRSAPGSRLNATLFVGGLLGILPLLVILALNLDRNPHSLRSPLIGQPAPSFSLAPLSGGARVSLESLRGRPVVVNFWATWCKPCHQEHAELSAAASRLRDVQFLGVVYEDEEGSVRSFLRDRGSAYPSLMDPGGRTAIAYGVYGVPETYFIDGDGRIMAKHAGPIGPDTIDDLLRKIRDER